MSYQFFAGSPGTLAPVAVEAECRDDATALLIASRLATDADQAEVWQGSRLVCCVRGKRRAAQAKQWPGCR